MHLGCLSKLLQRCKDGQSLSTPARSTSVDAIDNAVLEYARNL